MTDVLPGGQPLIAGDEVIFIGRDNTGTINVGDESHNVVGRPNPYLGLASFTYEMRERYAGRERQIVEALGLLTTAGDERTVLFVTGASGSGKSSFAQAGLVPALEKHYSQLGLTTKWTVFRPSRFPLAGLARSLAELRLTESAESAVSASTLAASGAFNRVVESRTPAGQVNVVVIDQFEEVFTQSDPAQRDDLMSILTGASSFEDLRTHVIVTVRADYLPALFKRRDLFAVVKQQSVDLRAMTSDELARAIVRPLEAQNEHMGSVKSWQPALVQRLSDDAIVDAALLPLLQVTLEALWRGGMLTVDCYRSLTDALKGQAEAAYSGSSQPEPHSDATRAVVMAIFLDLVRVSLDGDVRHDSRRSMVKTDLEDGDPERAAVIALLVDARLLSVQSEQRGESQVELIDIIHETLITNWSRLRDAIKDRRETLQQRERFTLAVKDWNDHRQSDEYLVSGVRLAEARALQKSDAGTFRDPAAARMLAQSVARAHRTVRRVAGIGLLVLFLVICIAAYAFFERREALIQSEVASYQRKEALSRLLAAQSLAQVENHFDLALLLALEATTVANTLEAHGSLLYGLMSNQRLSGFLLGHTDDVNSVAFSPDGKSMASGGQDGALAVWDVSTRRLIYRISPGNGSAVSSVAYSPDGRTLASGGADKMVTFWDAATGRAIDQPRSLPTGRVNSVAFSPDGKTLASAAAGKDGRLILWDVVSGQQRDLPLTHAGEVLSVAFSADGTRLVSGDRANTVSLWDISARQAIGRPLTGHSSPVQSVAFSPTDGSVASGSEDGLVIVWDLTSEHPVPRRLRGHTDQVRAVAFSPDGSRIASVGRDETVMIWDSASGRVIGQPLVGHTRGVLSVAFSPDGTKLATGGRDAAVILWDIATPRRLIDHPGGVTSAAVSPDGQTLASGVDAGVIVPPSAVNSVAISPDGQTLASAVDDGTIVLWSVATGQRIRQLPTVHTRGVLSVAFSPDGSRLVSGGRDDSFVLWDVATGQTIDGPLREHTDAVKRVAFSPDGRWLVSAARDGHVIVRDVANGRRIDELPPAPNKDKLFSVAFSPDSRTLAAAGINGTIMLWDMATHVPVGAPLTGHRDAVNSLAFSSDGKTLASGSGDDTIILWDIASGRPLGSALTDHRSSVETVAFSPDGKVLASGSKDGMVILWDVATRRPLGRPLIDHEQLIDHEHKEGVSSVTFSSDGRTLASGGVDGSVRLWKFNLEPAAHLVCAIVARPLTQDEWDLYLHDEPYRKTCPEI